MRIRIESVEAGSSAPAASEATLTIKGPTAGLSRFEFEYPLPVDEARVILNELCQPPIIDKHRYRERHGNHVWEIDVFHGDNEGLIVAEVELEAEDDVLELPGWVDREVSSDWRYSNASLTRYPFKHWSSEGAP